MKKGITDTYIINDFFPLKLKAFDIKPGKELERSCALQKK